MELEQKLKAIKWDVSPSSQVEILESFNELSDAELAELTSTRFIKWPEAGMAIRYLGFPKLYAYRSDLLVFLQDINWPAANYVADLLASSGSLILPEIQSVLQIENDSIWHYWIIDRVVSEMSLEALALLKVTLIMVMKRADKEGASVAALKAIGRLINKDELEVYYQFLWRSFAGDEYAQNDLQSALNSTAGG